MSSSRRCPSLAPNLCIGKQRKLTKSGDLTSVLDKLIIVVGDFVLVAAFLFYIREVFGKATIVACCSLLSKGILSVIPVEHSSLMSPDQRPTSDHYCNCCLSDLQR